MKKSYRILLAALLGANLIWGVAMAQNRPPDQGQSNRGPGFEDRQDQRQRQQDRPDQSPDRPGTQSPGGANREMGNAPGNPPPGGPDGIRDNPKVQAETKRHNEAMKGFFEQIKALREKIKGALESAINKIEGAGPDDQNRPQGEPDKRNNPPPNRRSGNLGNRTGGEGQQPPEGPKPPDETAIPGTNNGPSYDKLPDEVKKILEPFRTEADAISEKIAAEFVIHYQNMAKIVAEEKDNVKKVTSDLILMPPRQKGPGGESKPDGRPDNKGERRGPPPNRDNRQGPPPDDNDHQGPPPDKGNQQGPPPGGGDRQGPPPENQGE